MIGGWAWPVLMGLIDGMKWIRKQFNKVEDR